jgi:8-oxo-dGTP pyrophosphatase MutT (NUDIX family)
MAEAPPPVAARPASPVPARPAATVLLVRDGAAGLEVFMVVRHREIEFAGGALVFPGGRVEDADATLAGDDPLGAFRIAGIRETFEECGVLLAREPGAAEMIQRERLLAVADRHHAALMRNARSLPEVLAAEGLEPATDALAHWAHWVTPASRSKRFDTQFFLAAAPPDQLAVHDGLESVESVWIAPAQAVAEADAGKRRLVFATRKNLEKLARHATVADALAASRAATVVRVQPEMVRSGGGWRIRIPAKADYGGDSFDTLDAPAI